MLLHKIITPLFIKRFECIGSDCISHCCREWHIGIDKKTYKRYQHTENIEIRNIAQQYVIRTSENSGSHHYAFVRFNQHGNCPFFSQEGLCGIYKALGPSAMSDVCRNYPRNEKEYKQHTFKKLFLSCSHAVHLLLFSEDAMNSEEIIEHRVERKLINKKTKSAHLSSEYQQDHEIIYLWCINLLQAESQDIEDNLFAIIQFLIFIQQVDYKVEQNFERIQDVFAFLHQSIIAGEIGNNRKDITQHTEFKVSVIGMVGQLIKNTNRGRSYLLPTFINITTVLELDENQTKQRTAQNILELENVWQELKQNSCLKQPHVIRNFIHYLFYQNDFPQGDLQYALQELSHIIIDYFYFKISIAAQIKIEEKELTEQDLQLQISSYFTMKYHNQQAKEKLRALLEESKLGDDLSCLLLLN